MSPEFKYNNINAKCEICSRTQNPHPDFDEPPVTAIIRYSIKFKIEICINCFYDLQALSRKKKITFKNMIKQKLNILRLTADAFK